MAELRGRGDALPGIVPSRDLALPLLIPLFVIIGAFMLVTASTSAASRAAPN